MTKKSKIHKTSLWNRRIANSKKFFTSMKKNLISGDISCSLSMRDKRSLSVSRVKNRCKITGRPRGYMRYFGMSRNCVFLYASLGYLPGVVKVKKN